MVCCIVMGANGSAKSSIVQALRGETYRPYCMPTVGIDVHTHRHNGVMVQVWEVGTDMELYSCALNVIRRQNAGVLDIAIIVADATRTTTREQWNASVGSYISLLQVADMRPRVLWLLYASAERVVMEPLGMPFADVAPPAPLWPLTGCTAVQPTGDSVAEAWAVIWAAFEGTTHPSRSPPHQRHEAFYVRVWRWLCLHIPGGCLGGGRRRSHPNP